MKLAAQDSGSPVPRRWPGNSTYPVLLPDYECRGLSRRRKAAVFQEEATVNLSSTYRLLY